MVGRGKRQKGSKKIRYRALAAATEPVRATAAGPEGSRQEVEMEQDRRTEDDVRWVYVRRDRSMAWLHPSVGSSSFYAVAIFRAAIIVTVVTRLSRTAVVKLFSAFPTVLLSDATKAFQPQMSSRPTFADVDAEDIATVEILHWPGQTHGTWQLRRLRVREDRTVVDAAAV